MRNAIDIICDRQGPYTAAQKFKLCPRAAELDRSLGRNLAAKLAARLAAAKPPIDRALEQSPFGLAMGALHDDLRVASIAEGLAASALRNAERVECNLAARIATADAEFDGSVASIVFVDNLRVELLIAQIDVRECRAKLAKWSWERERFGFEVAFTNEALRA